VISSWPMKEYIRWSWNSTTNDQMIDLIFGPHKMCWCNKKHFIVNFLHTYLWLLLITLKCKIWSLFWKRQRKCHVSLFQYRSWPEFWTIDTKLPRNDHWKVLYKVSVFYADRKSKMATTAGHRLTLDPMGKCSNAFFSETTNQTESKLDRNVHWLVLYKV
jgi:hypothetical protein